MKINIFAVILILSFIFINANGDDDEWLIVDRIISGTEAVPGQFPWQVALRIKKLYDPKNHFCGGIFIDPKWVITAAHCAYTAEKFQVFLGGVTLNETEDGRIVVLTTSFIIHPDYNARTLINDIALIKLPRPVTTTHRIKPITLAAEDLSIKLHSKVIVSGWGKTGDNATRSTILSYTQLATVDNSECVKIFGNKSVTSSTLCAVGKPPHGPCQGDSGGPLIMPVKKDLKKKAILVGVVSLGDKHHCERGSPSGYAKISSFRKWIYENTGV